jgi:phospholipid transport system substrate-binding protein
MHRRLFIATCGVAAIGVVLPGATAEIATDSPIATVASLQAGLIAAGARPSSTLAERYRELEPLVVATHDLPYIAEFALRRQWGALAADERERFITAFRRLSVTTYAARFANVAPDTFRPIEAGAPDENGRVQVTTAIKREGQPDISLEYLLEQQGGEWKIINIVADGVSDLALKRAEYQRVFSSGGIAGLIAELEQQTDRLEQD